MMTPLTSRAFNRRLAGAGNFRRGGRGTDPRWEPGRIFTDGTMPEANQWQDVCIGYPGGTPRFVAVSNNGTNRAAYSNDGKTFTAGTINGAVVWNGVCWSPSDNRYYACGVNTIAFSTDGITFTDIAGVPAQTYRRIIAGSGETNYLVATHDAGAVYSSNGSTFTSVASGTNNRKVAHNPASGGRYVSIDLGSVSQRAAYSDDGVTWTLVNTPNTPSQSNWRGLLYSSRLGLWVACGGVSNGFMYSGDNGASWTSGTPPDANNYSSVVEAAELKKLVAVSSSGTGVRAAYSYDGITFQSITLISASSWQAICWAPTVGPRGRFVTVSFNGICAYSG